MCPGSVIVCHVHFSIWIWLSWTFLSVVYFKDICSFFKTEIFFVFCNLALPRKLMKRWNTPDEKTFVFFEGGPSRYFHLEKWTKKKGILLVGSLSCFSLQVIIRDHQLFGMVAVLLLIDFIILITWELVDPLTSRDENLALEVWVILVDTLGCPWYKFVAFYRWTVSDVSYIWAPASVAFRPIILWWLRRLHAHHD